MYKVFFENWLVKDQVHESIGMPRSCRLLIDYLVHCSLLTGNKNKRFMNCNKESIDMCGYLLSWVSSYYSAY
jgi:hypothetical protein